MRARRSASGGRWIGGFLVAVVFAALASTAPASTSAVEADAALAVKEVGPGVFVHVGAIEDWTPAAGGDVANLGFVVGNRCVAVVDTGGTPAVGRLLRAAIERITRLPVCYVINTHAHPDHVLGNAAFVEAAGRESPAFVASARFAHMLSQREPYYQNALQRDFGIAASHETFVYPTQGVDRTLELDLGDRILSLRAWPTAHTDNDLTVYDRRTRTLFASDLLFVRHLPVLDGSLRGWLEALAQLRCLDVSTVVPGHGDPSADWPGTTDAEATYLRDLLRDTRAAVRDLVTIQQAVDRIPVGGGPDWRLTERFHRRNVTAAYSEIEWEDDASRDRQAPSGACPVPDRSGTG